MDAEFTLPLVALACDAATIVKGADTSRMVDAIAASRGGGVRVVPPGEIHLFDELSRHGGELAGEGNGSVMSLAPGSRCPR
jgi:phosphomannomutase